MHPSLIRTERLSKSFSFGSTQQHVLRNIDLDIRRGEFTVLMGPSGAGKSTLLHALSGMERPALGIIDFAGTRIEKLGESQLARFRRQHCGFVFQQSHLLDSMSAMDNVLTAGLLPASATANTTASTAQRVPRADVIARARELFDLVGLGETEWRKMPKMLSGGEVQRVAIVRALINQPSVVFADEPTGQLNSLSGADVLDLFGTVHRNGQTLVVVTHDLTTALRGERILYLRDGTIQGELRLPPYTGDADTAGAGSRHATVTTFLTRQGW